MYKPVNGSTFIRSELSQKSSAANWFGSLCWVHCHAFIEEQVIQIKSKKRVKISNEKKLWKKRVPVNVARYVVDSLLLLSYAFVFINTGDQNDLTYSASCHIFSFFSHFAHCSVIFMNRRCVIEVDDVIPTRYTLTVGTFRNFYNRFHDFHNFINRTINCHAFFFFLIIFHQRRVSGHFVPLVILM